MEQCTQPLQHLLHTYAGSSYKVHSSIYTASILLVSDARTKLGSYIFQNWVEVIFASLASYLLLFRNFSMHYFKVIIKITSYSIANITLELIIYCTSLLC